MCNYKRIVLVEKLSLIAFLFRKYIFQMAKIEVVIKHADMSEDMINVAIDSATQALQK